MEYAILKRYLPYALLALASLGWFFTWRSRQRVEPNLIVIADPDHYPDSVRLIHGWWVRGYHSHCLVADNETKTIRPFYEHSLCRAEAQQQLLNYKEVVPITPDKGQIPHKH